jgi:hypothetical protein
MVALDVRQSYGDILAGRCQGKPPNHSAGLASSSLDRSVRVATAIALSMQKFQPLGHHLHIEKLTPIALPPGRARLATGRPLLERGRGITGVPPERADRPTPQGSGRRSREAIELLPARHRPGEDLRLNCWSALQNAARIVTRAVK